MSKSILKTGILVSTLLVPVFVFLFLKTCSTNHFVLPRFVPLVDSTTGKLVMKKTFNAYLNKEVLDTVFRTLPAFNFLDQDSASFGSAQVEGKIKVANFIFTRCGLICPATTRQMQRVQDAFEENTEVVLLSHTVDPRFDTPSVLKKFGQKYDANFSQWKFLTGDKAKLYQMILKGYYLPVSDASVYDSSITDLDKAFIHSEKIVLLDKEGIIRGFYDGTKREEVDRLLLEIKILLDIYKKQ
jgi:protein SCO1